MGFIKAGSKASLIASSLFSAVLALFAINLLPFEHHVEVLVILVLFFAVRLAKSKKFMPNGMMTILTLVALILPRFLKP